MSYIEVKNIKKSFDGKLVLNDINLKVAKGEFATFLGSSGCGKTTLLRCLIGLETVDSGTILLEDEDITWKSANKRGMSMIFQQYSLFPTMTVYDNVAFGLKMKSVRKDEIDRRVKDALYMVGLNGHENKYTYQMSGGEQQRVSLARSLIMKPKVLLLDEPFSAIDAKLRKELQVYLKEIHKELGMTSIFVTHDQEEAMRMSDSIHLFHDGVLEQSGTPEQIYARPRTPYVASFIGNYNILDAADYTAMVSALPARGQVAFRPEIISITAQPQEENGLYDQMSGIIENRILQGNVVRYMISVQNKTIIADEIFGSAISHQIGDAVYLRIAKENVLHYPE